MSRPLEETIGLIAAQGYVLTIDLTAAGWIVGATNPDSTRPTYTPTLYPNAVSTDDLVAVVESLHGAIYLDVVM